MAKTKEAKKPAGRGRKKGEQQHLPGTGPTKHAVIHPLAIEYVRVRDARMDMNKEEVKLKDRLTEAMHAAGMKLYEYDDINVVLTVEENLKVKRANSEGE